jgi:hypothetical protein
LWRARTQEPSPLRPQQRGPCLTWTLSSPSLFFPPNHSSSYFPLTPPFAHILPSHTHNSHEPRPLRCIPLTRAVPFPPCWSSAYLSLNHLTKQAPSGCSTQCRASQHFSFCCFSGCSHKLAIQRACHSHLLSNCTQFLSTRPDQITQETAFDCILSWFALPWSLGWLFTWTCPGVVVFTPLKAASALCLRRLEPRLTAMVLEPASERPNLS